MALRFRHSDATEKHIITFHKLFRNLYDGNLYIAIHNYYSKYMKNITTIQLKKSTRLRLLEIGMKKETYDDLINRLVDTYLKGAGRQAG